VRNRRTRRSDAESDLFYFLADRNSRDLSGQVQGLGELKPLTAEIVTLVAGKTGQNVAELDQRLLAFHRRNVADVFAGLFRLEEASQDFAAAGLRQRSNEFQSGGRRNRAQFPSHMFDEGGG
jgi:hypothetical protein